MDYKEKYEAALERAKHIHEVINDVGKKDLEAIFPELAEREDERIRKEIVEFLDEVWHRGKNANFDRWDKSDCVKWIAYLEKHKEQEPLSTEETELNSIAFLEQMGYTCILQKEQKPSHKFNIGDTIHCKYDDREFTIESVDLMNGVYKYTKEGCGNDIDYADENFELVEQQPAEWSEEDEDAIEMAVIALEDMYNEDEPLTTYGGHNLPFNVAADRLKSLRPQPHWKPSEEQN